MSTRVELQQQHGLGLDTFAYDMAKRLLACLDEQLEHTLGGRPCRSAVYPGEEIVPMDTTCEGRGCHGQSATRVYRISPMTGRLPQQDYAPRLHTCQRLSYMVTIEATVYRCAAVVNDNGDPPSVKDVEWNTRMQMDDAAALRRAVRCCYSPQADGELRDQGITLPYTTTGEYVEDDYNPVGPAGDGFGSRQRFIIPVYDVDCSCPPVPIDPALR